MKKQNLILGTLALSLALLQNANAQTPSWDFTVPNTITTLNTTHVGINTTVSPSWALTVNGAMGFQGDYSSNPGNTDMRHIAGHSRNGLVLWSTQASGGFTNGSAILLNSNHTNGEISDKGSITFAAAPDNGTDPAFNFVIGNDGFASRMIINKDGQVGLGTNILNNDNLTVNGAMSFSATWTDPGSGHTDWYKHIKGRSRDYGMVIFSNDDDWANSSGIIMNSVNSSDAGIGFVATSNGTNDAYTFKTYTPSSTTWDIPLLIKKNGDIGIGTTNPISKLTVDGDFSFATNTGAYRHISANSNYGLALLSTNASSGWTDGSGILLNSNSGGSVPDKGAITFVSTPTNSSDVAFNFVLGNSSWDSKMHIQKDGQVIIGNVNTVTTNDYKLYVETGILTEKLKVAIPGSAEWSDYVFADDYSLKSLDEVENFIKENKHLPDMPSAETVAKNGIDVAKMDATLLRKIEELTLYVIQQQKEIKELKSKLNK